MRSILPRGCEGWWLRAEQKITGSSARAAASAVMGERPGLASLPQKAPKALGAFVC